jgi:hypothetical protein
MRASREAKFNDEDRLAEILLGLECSLMDPVFRKDRERVSSLLTEEFREFGSSGLIWTREAILDKLATEQELTTPEVLDFAIRQLGPETVLATYRTLRTNAASGEIPASLRSSLWVFREGRWQMFFHQGTRVPDAGC